MWNYFHINRFTHVSQLRKFRYLMRLDDDACILDPIHFDIFKRMQAEKITYAYKQIFLDPNVYVVGLDAFAESYMRENELKWSNVPLRQQAKRLTGGHLLSFSTNLEALDMNKYRSTDNKRSVLSFCWNPSMSFHIIHYMLNDIICMIFILLLIHRNTVNILILLFSALLSNVLVETPKKKQFPLMA